LRAWQLAIVNQLARIIGHVCHITLIQKENKKCPILMRNQPNWSDCAHKISAGLLQVNINEKHDHFG
jgi:hypothetical protein